MNCCRYSFISSFIFIYLIRLKYFFRNVEFLKISECSVVVFFVTDIKMQYLEMLGAAEEELGGGSAEFSVRRTQ